MNKKLGKLTLAEIPEPTLPSSLKSFTITNNGQYPRDITLEHPSFFEGIIFILCMKGNARVKISFVEYQIEESSIITILPNQIIENVDQSDDFFAQVLIFSSDFLSNLMPPKDYDIYRKIIHNPVLKISEEETQNILRYHSFIVDTRNNKKHQFMEQIIKGLMYSLLLEVSALYLEHKIEVKEKNSSRSAKITQQFFTLLKEHHKEGRTASYYAEKMFITPKYLSSILKKVTGRPVSAWIEDAITIRAKILLKSTELTVLQISEELNFPNASYFGRFFKKKTGMTPRNYRENREPFFSP